MFLTGYDGEFCQRNIDECTVTPPCQNGATCMDTPGSYKCQCQLGFSGKNCEDVSYYFNTHILF